MIIDVYSRRIIGWTTSNHRTANLALHALDRAIRSRNPPPGAIVHSDRGYQFTSWEWTAAVEAAGLRPSIGRVGAAHDNALIESWFSSFKNEAIYPYPMPKTRQQARRALFEHVTFHNQRRLHSALDYTTPNTYEQNTVST